MSEHSRFTLDPSYRRPADGAVLLAGSPLVLLRLGPAGVRIARALERGDELPAGHRALTDRLLDIGAIHPPTPPTSEAPAGEAPAGDADLTIVVPAYREVPRVVSRRSPMVVVDDASPTPLAIAADAPPRAPVLLRRLPVNAGPGAARNAGLAEVRTELVAFIDTDVDCSDADLARLAAHFADPRVALVAPRVLASADHAGSCSRYEQACSPLDLGATPARIAPGSRVSYVPAALVVCRADAVRSVGGFDPTLRYGEDVDLVWRLHQAGWRCRYEPSVVVRHRTRPDLRAWLAQRYHYGTSAGPLAARHPGALAPVRTSGWSAAVWAAVASGHLATGAALATGTAAALARRVPDLPARECWRLAGTGHLWAGRLLAATWGRAWWPAAALTAVVSRRGRRWLAAALAVQAVEAIRTEPRPRGPLAVLERIAMRVLDDAAYGAGVWAGAIRNHSADALAPALTTWPGRRRRPSGARAEA